jgi:hypothetical protein
VLKPRNVPGTVSRYPFTAVVRRAFRVKTGYYSARQRPTATLCNNYRSRYARLIVECEADLQGFFTSTTPEMPRSVRVWIGYAGCAHVRMRITSPSQAGLQDAAPENPRLERLSGRWILVLFCPSGNLSEVAGF